MDEFIKGSCVGTAHLLQLTKGKGKRTFADFCAEYSIDRAIPFLAGAIMLKDYLSVIGCFPAIDIGASAGKTNYALKKWLPRNVRYVPPVAHSKLEKSNESSLPGLKDNYILQTYLDAGCKITGVAKLLGISRGTATKLINELGVPEGIRKSPETVFEWVRECKEDYEIKREEGMLPGSVDTTTKTRMIPAEKTRQ